jgi:hypothetical protein
VDEVLDLSKRLRKESREVLETAKRERARSVRAKEDHRAVVSEIKSRVAAIVR